MDRKLGAGDSLPVGGWRREQSRGGDPYAPLRLLSVYRQDQIHAALQSSEDGNTWQTQLAGVKTCKCAAAKKMRPSRGGCRNGRDS